MPVADRRCRRHHYGCVAFLLAAAFLLVVGIGASSGPIVGSVLAGVLARGADAGVRRVPAHGGARVSRGSLLASSISASTTARSPGATASVVGGAAAAISRFPFQVALYDPRRGPPAKSAFCGGVIVDATQVITAAHCLTGTGPGSGGVSRNIEVLAGSAHLGRPDPGSVRDPALKVSIDPSYNPASSDYDIGILTLKRALWRGSSAPSPNGASAIAPVALDRVPAAGYSEANATPARIATVSGWGETNPSPFSRLSYPSTLRSVRVPLFPKALCQEIYAVVEQAITPRMLCAGGSRPRADSCYGDSGGPLVVDRDRPRPAPRGLRARRARRLWHRLRMARTPRRLHSHRRPRDHALPRLPSQTPDGPYGISLGRHARRSHAVTKQSRHGWPLASIVLDKRGTGCAPGRFCGSRGRARLRRVLHAPCGWQIARIPCIHRRCRRARWVCGVRRSCSSWGLWRVGSSNQARVVVVLKSVAVAMGLPGET